MEKVDISLAQFTLAQKLYLMEMLWEDLTKNEKIIESPAWHEEILKEREKALSANTVSISDWDEAKDRISYLIS